jgi:hypothetical protein
MAEDENRVQQSYRCYSIIERKGRDDVWLNVGRAFSHDDHCGFDIILRGPPHAGKIVCREIAAGEEINEPRVS